MSKLPQYHVIIVYRDTQESEREEARTLSTQVNSSGKLGVLEYCYH